MKDLVNLHQNFVPKHSGLLALLEIHDKISTVANPLNNNPAVRQLLDLQARVNPFANNETLKNILASQDILRKHFHHFSESISHFNFDFDSIYQDELEFEQKNEDKDSIVISETKQIQLLIADIYRENKILYKIESREFEHIIAELLLHKGFKVELTKQTRDGGFDIIALQHMAGSPLKFLVECKRYGENRPIGVDIIRAFSEVINQQNANKGIIFTTSYFSKDSVDYRDKNKGYLLDFKDKNDIVDWVSEYWISVLSKKKT